MERRLLEKYRNLFVLWGIQPRMAIADSFLPVNKSVVLAHAAWMVEEMIGHIEESKAQAGQPDRLKASRWIGFIQGVLWANGFCKIDELRQHVSDAKKASE
jgi:hypothetical protein